MWPGRAPVVIPLVCSTHVFPSGLDPVSQTECCCISSRHTHKSSWEEVAGQMSKNRRLSSFVSSTTLSSSPLVSLKFISCASARADSKMRARSIVSKTKETRRGRRRPWRTQGTVTTAISRHCLNRLVGARNCAGKCEEFLAFKGNLIFFSHHFSFSMRQVPSVATA